MLTALCHSVSNLPAASCFFPHWFSQWPLMVLCCCTADVDSTSDSSSWCLPGHTAHCCTAVVPILASHILFLYVFPPIVCCCTCHGSLDCVWCHQSRCHTYHHCQFWLLFFTIVTCCGSSHHLLQCTMLLSILMPHLLPCSNAVVSPLVIVALYFFDAAPVIACRCPLHWCHLQCWSVSGPCVLHFLLFLGLDTVTACCTAWQSCRCYTVVIVTTSWLLLLILYPCHLPTPHYILIWWILMKFSKAECFRWICKNCRSYLDDKARKNRFT